RSPPAARSRGGRRSRDPRRPRRWARAGAGVSPTLPSTPERSRAPGREPDSTSLNTINPSTHPSNGRLLSEPPRMTGVTLAVEIADVSKLDVEPGELPEKMAAWVIRQDREGEPKDAFQVEEIEVPEPGAFEVSVRVMAAGVNFNNVWAALGKPVSVFGYGDHPQWGHHIGGSDASGIVWKVGEGVTKWKPGDEVVIHCNQASYEDVEVHGLDPLAAPS